VSFVAAPNGNGFFRALSKTLFSLLVLFLTWWGATLTSDVKVQGTQVLKLELHFQAIMKKLESIEHKLDHP